MAQQKAKKAIIKGEISYLISTPKEYSKSGDAVPLLIFLHGSGERGADLNMVKKWGPPKIIANGGELPFIVVSPQCPNGEFWNSFLLKGLIDEIIDSYNVDKSRIYLTGLSMGGFGTFDLAMAYPDLFAAVAPVCGGGNAGLAFLMKDIPTWVFHGKLDKAVPYERSVEMVEALKQLGADPVFTTLDEGGHVDAWVHAYNEAGLWDWFLKHKK
jgi:predicted peptidase